MTRHAGRGCPDDTDDEEDRFDWNNPITADKAASAQMPPKKVEAQPEVKPKVEIQPVVVTHHVHTVILIDWEDYMRAFYGDFKWAVMPWALHPCCQK